MNLHIVDTIDPVTLIGAAYVSPKALKEVLRLAPILIAADGGAHTALKIGRVPDAVIGDFDSLSTETIAQIPPERMFQVFEQDSTDFDKCLSRIKAPLILAVGFTGGRQDHGLAGYSSLLRFAGQSCVLIGEEDVCFLMPPRLHLDLPDGTVFSLFPMGECRVGMAGLRWSFEDLQMSPQGQIGTSNEVAGTGGVQVAVDARCLLGIVPLVHLAAVMHALIGARGK